MKVSIITVAYNAATTISETLSSVKSQSYPDIEHIIIDGLSTDGTQEVIQNSSNHIAAFISEKDLGIYDAMNKGIALATGEIIGILNADDIYFDNSIIENIVRIFREKDLDAIYGDVAYFHNFSSNKAVRRYSSKNFSPNKIAWGWMPAHPTLFLKRNVYENYGLYKTDYKIAGDFEFIARIFCDNKLHYHYIPETLVKMHLGGVSTQGWRNSIILNKEVLRACHDNNIDTNIFKVLSKYPKKILELFPLISNQSKT